MSAPFLPRIGGVMSADIAVPEHERELAFYSGILCTGEEPLWREDLMNNLGMPIIGLGARTPEYAHLPLQWMPHIQVADVATSASCAVELGGKELMHGKDDAGRSQWAVLVDPNGAAFGIIPIVSDDELPTAEGTPSPEALASAGRITGMELTVAEASATRDYYRRVVGWTAQDGGRDDTGGLYSDYTMLGDDGAPAAGIHHDRGVDVGLPQTWLISIPVGDLAESLRRVREAGGKVIQETRGDRGECTHAVIQDPVGAHFALVPG